MQFAAAQERLISPAMVLKLSASTLVRAARRQRRWADGGRRQVTLPSAAGAGEPLDTAESTGRKSLESTGWNMTSTGARREWQRADVHVVLVNPQIPQNAGNVARTCAATSVALHLVGPLGFELDSAKLKRAGLDYWAWVCCSVHPTFQDFQKFFDSLPGPKRIYAFSKLGKRHYAEEGLYQPGTWLLFGAETTGLPPAAHAAAPASGGDVVKIPMGNYRHVRSLNLATSVGIGVFEALRQLDGPVLPEDLEAEEGSAEAEMLHAASTATMPS